MFEHLQYKKKSNIQQTFIFTNNLKVFIGITLTILKNNIHFYKLVSAFIILIQYYQKECKTLRHKFTLYLFNMI